MHATARMASVVSSTLPARRRLIRAVSPRNGVHCEYPKMASSYSPQAHLERAKDLLASERTEQLFYAAIEFRFCVEGQLHYFAEAADAHAKRRGNPWSAKDLGKHVDSVFGPENTYIVELSSDRLADPVRLEYVPVSARARSLLGQIDNFLHYAGVLQCYTEEKENLLRGLLADGIAEMERSLASDLQGSLVMNPFGIVNMTIDLERHPELQASLKAGDSLRCRIDIAPYVTVVEDLDEFTNKS